MNKILVASSLYLVVLSSCVKIPVSKYEQLNNSTQSLNIQIAETYHRIEKIQRRYVVTRAPDSAMAKNTFVPMVLGVSIDLTPELTNRAAALDVIAKYTNVIYLFSSKDYLKEVDHASGQLSGSIKTFSKTSLRRKPDQSTIIGNVFGMLSDAASKQMIDRKRIKVLKSVMDSTQNYIVALSNLLIHDNTLFGNAIDQWRSALIRHANAVRPEYATLGRYEFDLEFANLLDEISGIQQSLEISNKVLAELPKVFLEIRLLLDKKDVRMNALEDLISEGQRLSNVYNNLNK